MVNLIGQATPMTEKNKVLRLGILGAANIAPNAVIKPSRLLSDIVVVQGVAARDLKKATDYAKKYKIPKVYSSYQELIDSDEIDAIYNPLPNGLHAEWTIKSLKAGKHVLCEKPFTSNAKEAEYVKKFHDGTKLSLVEAFHYRYHPLTKRIKEIIDKDIGKMISIDVEFTLPLYVHYLAFGDDDIRWNFDLAGGVTMDVGCYCINALNHFGGHIEKVIKAEPGIMKEDIDISMDAEFEMKNGSRGHMYCNFKKMSLLPVALSLKAVGELGTVYCNNLMAPYLYHYVTTNIKGVKNTEKVYSDGQTTYYYQLKAFCDEISGKSKCETTPSESIEVMKVIDEIYKAAGLHVRPSKLKFEGDEKSEEIQINVE